MPSLVLPRDALATMEARATQQSRSAFPEAMRQPSSRNASPASSPALHLPLTATTVIRFNPDAPFSASAPALPALSYTRKPVHVTRGSDAHRATNTHC